MSYGKAWTKCLLIFVALVLTAAALTGCAVQSAEYPTPETGRIAVLVGTTSETLAETEFPTAQILKFDALSDAVTALISNKADYVVSALTNCANYAKHNDGLVIMSKQLSSDAAAIAINKDETKLYEDICAIVERFREDGTLARLEETWISSTGSDYPSVSIPDAGGAELNIAISADREPMCFVRDGELAGLDVELACLLASELGMKPVFHDMKFAAMIPSVVSNVTQIAISNLSPTPERAESVNFSPTYLKNPQVLLTRKENPVAAEREPLTLKSLNGRDMGVLTGTTFDAATQTTFPDSKRLYFNSVADMSIAVEKGIIAGYVEDEPVARMVITNNKAMAMLPELIAEDKYGFAFAKGASDERYLSEMNEFIAELKSSGEMDRLLEVWMSADESKQTVIDPSSLPATNGVIRFGTSAQSMPFVYMRNNEYVGFDIDVITRFCKEKGYGLEITVMNFDAIIPALVSGKLDLAADCITITEERAQSVNFTNPTYYGGLVVVVSAKELNGGDGTSPSSSSVGTLTGTTCETIAMQLYPDAELSRFTTLADCMTALKSGQVNYAVVMETDGSKYAQNDAAFEVVDKQLALSHYNVAVAKERPELLNRIDALLSRYKEDGTFDRLKANWLKDDGSAYVIDEVPELEGVPELRVATSAGFEPMGFYKDGKLTGFDIELAKRLAYDLGMRAKFTDMDFQALIPALQSGSADVILSGMSSTDERAESVNFSQSYFDAGIALVRRTGVAKQNGDVFASLAESFEKNFIREQRWKLIVSGIGVTLLISICSAVFGSAVGFGVCMMRRSRYRALSGIAKVYIRLLQGTPVVVLLMILFYIVLNRTGLSGVTVAIIAFGLNYGAYASEMLRTGIDAVDRGQLEAAAAIGFKPRETFTKIVFPQAARHFLPVMKGEFISLVKMTSVVGYVAVQDLTKASDIIRSRTYEAFFPLIVTAIIYFLLSWGLSLLLTLVEVRIDPKRRKLKLGVLSGSTEPSAEGELKGGVSE